jgi:hypothetical protein
MPIFAEKRDLLGLDNWEKWHNPHKINAGKVNRIALIRSKVGHC